VHINFSLSFFIDKQLDTHIFIAKSNPNLDCAHNVSSTYLPNGRFRYWQYVGRGRPNWIQLYLFVRWENILRNTSGWYRDIFRSLNKKNNSVYALVCVIVKIHAYYILLSKWAELGKVSWNPQHLFLDLRLCTLQ